MVGGAHLSLVLHNLGESRNSSVLEEAEDNLNNVFYTEEKLKFTFTRYVEIHRSAHNDMLSVPNYVVPNESTRVRKARAKELRKLAQNEDNQFNC